jgi:hypothetical protein
MGSRLSYFPHLNLACDLKIKLVRADCDKRIVAILRPLQIMFLSTTWQFSGFDGQTTFQQN